MPATELPRLGLGTYSSANREQWTENVATALEIGYRHIDTAQVYQNEEYVGEAIADADVDREEIFLATKTVHHDVPSSPEEVPAAIDGCLERLGVDYVDLLYVHWPTGIYDHESILPHYNDAYDEGKTRYVGLSNFSPEQVEGAKEVLEAPLLACQSEMHPTNHQDELLRYVEEEDLWLVAYSPLGQGDALSIPEVQQVAEKHGASPAQVTLAWLLAKENVAAIPKASSEAHLRENFAAQELELDDEDVALIDSIGE